MLKSKVSSLDELPESLREHYAANDTGEFELQLDGGLKSALAMERQHRRNAENRARELETQVRNAGGTPKQQESEMTPRERFFAQAEQRLKGLEGEAHDAEFMKIEAEMQSLIDTEVAESRKQKQAELEHLSQQHDQIFCEQEARLIVRDIVIHGSDEALMPHVVERLAVVRRDGKPVLVVRDRDGMPSSATIDELKEELRCTPAFAPLLRDAVAESAAHAKRVAETLGESTPRKPLTRSAFDRLSAASRAHHMSSGGEVVDDTH